MKTYWIYNGEEIKSGDTVLRYAIGVISHSRVCDISGRVLCEKSWDVGYFGPLSGSLSRIVIPDAVPFDALTGRRMVTGEISRGGGTVYETLGSAVMIRHNDTTTVVDRPLVAAAVAAGIEVRRNVTVSQYLNGLPRGLRCGNPVVTGVGRQTIRASEAVWTGRTYRWRDQFATDIHGMLRLRSRLPSGWRELPDGRVGPPSMIVDVTHGPSAGIAAAVADCYPVDGGWMLVAEMFDVYDRNGYHNRAPEIPEGYVPLTSGGHCHPAATAVCDHSGEVFVRRNRIAFRGNTYSRTSWEEIGARCDYCGSAFLRDGHADCPDCRASSRFRIRNYSNRSANDLRPEKDVPLKFGIELEVGCDRGVGKSECAALLSDAIERAGADPLSYCVYKEDGSLCDCNGIEIVTRPDCPSVHKRIFGGALRDPSLRGKMTSFDNNKCGLHVHVSRAPLNDLWIGRMLVLVNAAKMQPMIHAIAGRSGNRYTTYDPDKKLTSASRGNDRYEALNVTGRNTVEFRMFRGTLNPTSFITKIEFVEAVLAFTRPASRSLRETGEPSAFTKFIREEGKSFPNLSQFIISKGL